MGERTGIAYVDHTRNFWLGCTKVGPGCDNCYAEAGDARWKGAHWGPGAARVPYLEGAARDLNAWNLQAYKADRVRRVFLNTFSDTFDNEIDPAWRAFLWRTIKPLVHLRLLIVTKRIGNALAMLPPDWGTHGYPNVWLIATVCTQEELERDAPKLLQLPAALHGLSVGPMLEPINLGRFVVPGFARSVGWVICEGESGPAERVRAFNIDWARDLILQCHQCAFFMKQLGRAPYSEDMRWCTVNATRTKGWEMGHHRPGMRVVRNLKDGHGLDSTEWPEHIRVHQIPRV